MFCSVGRNAFISLWWVLIAVQSTVTVSSVLRAHSAPAARWTATQFHKPVRQEMPQVREVPIGVSKGQRDSAKKLVENTSSGGLVSTSRKIATVELAIKATEQDGDFLEAGTFTGGTAVLMAKVMLSPGQASARRLWLADSFQGLPEDVAVSTPSNVTKIDGLSASAGQFGRKGDMHSTREQFDSNLKKNGLLGNERITVLQGWFNETLPKAAIEKIAFLRLDGDLYVSTRDSLEALYEKVVPGGYIYVDDYGSFAGCKEAVDEFRKRRGIGDDMHPIAEDEGFGRFEAVWWRKSV